MDSLYRKYIDLNGNYILVKENRVVVVPINDYEFIEFNRSTSTHYNIVSLLIKDNSTYFYRREIQGYMEDLNNISCYVNAPGELVSKISFSLIKEIINECKLLNYTRFKEFNILDVLVSENERGYLEYNSKY